MDTFEEGYQCMYTFVANVPIRPISLALIYPLMGVGVHHFLARARVELINRGFMDWVNACGSMNTLPESRYQSLRMRAKVIVGKY